jgi:hypothetical protein
VERFYPTPEKAAEKAAERARVERRSGLVWCIGF